MRKGVAGPGKVLPSPKSLLVLAPMRGLIRSALFSVERVAGGSFATAMLANDRRLNSRLVIFISRSLSGGLKLWSLYGIGTISKQARAGGSMPSGLFRGIACSQRLGWLEGGQ